MDSIAHYYREINKAFLDRSWEEDQGFEFDIYYKADESDSPRFLKFGVYNADTRDRILKLFDADDHQLLYIHENDLIKHYNHLLSEQLTEDLSMGSPSIDILRKAYQISRQIMKEYFDNIGTSRILRTLEPAVKIIETCLNRGNLEFIDVYELTDKENNHYSHCVNNALYCMIFGRRLEMDKQDLVELGLGGMLFDIGKREIPDEVMLKEGKLTPEEFQAIRKHSSAGKKILNDMKCYSKRILAMAAEHHEKYDGKGYPQGLQGEDISYFARICGITDVFDALLCQRYNRDPLTPYEALLEMKEKMPGHFDSKILATFLYAFATSKQAA
jgi:HD-GYP domain-containing protein (c-di-GMP phosphodiesterase class II)